MALDMDKLVAAIERDCALTFGIRPWPFHKDLSVSRNGQTFFHMPVEQDHGIFRTIIKKSEIKVRVDPFGEDGRASYGVLIGLHYEHTHGGTNGYSIGSLWYDEDYRLVDSREG